MLLERNLTRVVQLVVDRRSSFHYPLEIGGAESARRRHIVWKRKKKPIKDILSVMGRDVSVASIIRDGNVLYTGSVVKEYPENYMQGAVFEISFPTKSGNPYFVYYICEDYYHAVVISGGSLSFGGPAKTEEFRSVVSQHIAAFLADYLGQTLKVDVSRDIKSFSHNRAHTNVLTYVSSLGNWYAIQHNDSEGDSASERKSRGVNSGRIEIVDVIAVRELSPSG